MARPQTLREASVVARDEPSDFAVALREFLDEFYLDHPDKREQASRIADPAEITGDPFTDAWIGATGEHLARRWGLEVPSWTLRPEHSRLTRPRFVPDARALRGMLIVISPPAFRSRLLFTVAEPLTRARFPRDAKRIEMPLRWPPKAAEDSRTPLSNELAGAAPYELFRGGFAGYRSTGSDRRRELRGAPCRIEREVKPPSRPPARATASG